MRVILKKYDSETYDITKSVGSKIEWSGSSTSAPRSLSLKFIRRYFDVDIDEGDRIYLYADKSTKSELFRGICYKIKSDQDLFQEVLVYDEAYPLVRNRDTFVFNHVTASKAFKIICSRFGIRTKEIADTGHIIQSAIYKNKKLYDIMIDLLAITYKNTGKRYYIRSAKGRLELIERRDNVLQLVIEGQSNLSRLDYTVDATKIYNKVKIESELKRSDKHFVTRKTLIDDDSVDKFGILQYYKKVNYKATESDVAKMAKSLLDENKRPKETLTLRNVLGQIDCISGNAIFLDFPNLGLSKSYYIQNDRHTFDNRAHTMDLQLLGAKELDK